MGIKDKLVHVPGSTCPKHTHISVHMYMCNITSPYPSWLTLKFLLICLYVATWHLKKKCYSQQQQRINQIQRKKFKGIPLQCAYMAAGPWMPLPMLQHECVQFVCTSVRACGCVNVNSEKMVDQKSPPYTATLGGFFCLVRLKN